jgi:SAM-dependent methyltransferase
MTAIRDDQRSQWIAHYGDAAGREQRPSAFVAACLPRLLPQSTVLELGCGRGVDAQILARAGHTVIATDFVPAVIASNRQRYAHLPNLTFEEMRIDERLPLADDTLDAVYAHLSLHYFSHDITKGILAEIHRSLKPGGWLMFACRSPQDPSWGRGLEIEPDLYDRDGKIRRFFSEGYTRQLLADGFTDIQIESHTGKLFRRRSAWITAIARTLSNTAGEAHR